MDSNSKMNWIKDIGSYYISDQFLGKGEYSKVYLGCEKKDKSNRMAIKVIDKSVFKNDEYILMTLERQFTLLKDLNHENIVRFYDMVETGHNWYFVFEYCNQGTLEDYLKKKNGRLSEAKALLILLELCEGFKELHKLNIMHRDLKPANVMLSNGVIKISDFSFARFMEGEKNEQLNYSLVGTPFYTPIQILEGREYSSKCDVWSLGVIFYQMLFGRFPYMWKALESKELDNCSISKLSEVIKKNNLDYPPGTKLSNQIKNLLEKLLEKEEKERYSWEGLFIDISKIDYSSLSNIPEKSAPSKMDPKRMETAGLSKVYIGATSGQIGKLTNFHADLKGSKQLKNAIDKFPIDPDQNNDDATADDILKKINSKIVNIEKAGQKSYHSSQEFKTAKKNKLPAQSTLTDELNKIKEDEDGFMDDMNEKANIDCMIKTLSYVPKNIFKSVSSLDKTVFYEKGAYAINEYLYYKRNIANFLDKVIQRIWQNHNLKKFSIPMLEFYQIMFCLIKYECMILESIDNIMKEKEKLDLKNVSSNLFQGIEYPEIWNYYKLSKYYQNLNEIIDEDLNFRKNCYLKEIYESLNDLVKKNPKQFRPAFVEIMNMNLFEDKKFISELNLVLEKLYKKIYKEYKIKKETKQKGETDLLILIKCVLLAFSPFDDFIWDMEGLKCKINFVEFFKKLDYETDSELINYINSKNLENLQNNLKAKFSSFINSAQFI